MPNLLPSATEEDSKPEVKTVVGAALLMKDVSTADICTTTNPTATFVRRMKQMAFSKNDATDTSPGVSAADAVENEEAEAKEAKDGAVNEEDRAVGIRLTIPGGR